MEYTFTRDFGFFKANDTLTWDEELGAFTMDVKDENGFRSAMLDERTAEDMYSEGILSVGIEPRDNKIDKTVEFIDTLLDTYAKDYEEMKKKADKGEVQPCVKVEAETVYYNLTKVLTRIKDELTNE